MSRLFSILCSSSLLLAVHPSLDIQASPASLRPSSFSLQPFPATQQQPARKINSEALKKRRLVHKSKTIFVDEIEGTPLIFNKDDDGKIVSVTFVYEGESYTATKLNLPAPSLKGNTTFRLKGYPDASIVALAGSFNNWNQSQFIFGREGDEWVCRIDLEPGKHAYKFIVDGNWLLDPANSNTEDDDYGVKNSVIIVVKDPGQ